MTDSEAIDRAIAITGVERYRFLCLEHPDAGTRAGYLRLCREIAEAGAMPRAYPPLLTQAGNLAGAAARFVGSGLALSSAEEVERRGSICVRCPHWDFAARRCRLCGCKTGWKIRIAAEHCPDNPPRW